MANEVNCSKNDENQDAPDLDFAGHNTLYATHGLHAYAAKCPPQLVRFAITRYSEPGQLVVDPMAGSGTTLVESRLLGRRAIGFDLDPLACLVARVKSNPPTVAEIDHHTDIIIGRVKEDLAEVGSQELSAQVHGRVVLPDFPRRDYWFREEASVALALLSHHIQDLSMPSRLEDFYWVAFSSLILSKVSVANARDIIHSRHHHFAHAEPPNVAERFRLRIKTMRRQISDFEERLKGLPALDVRMDRADARCLPLEDALADLVVTSPPYATALDYSRAHFLAVAWMRPVFGVSVEEYLAGSSQYVGSERGHVKRSFELAPELSPFPSARSALTSLMDRDIRQAHLIQRYFLDMRTAFGELQRVLRPGGHAFVVVCPSHVRRVQIPTQTLFTEIGESLGLHLVAQHERTINGNRRVLPYMREAFGDRMNTEYVLAFQKA